MVRPIKNNVDYFPHQNNMRNDKKIKALRSKFGNEGYAIYCMLLETLAEADCLLLELNEIEFEMVSGDFNIESDVLKNIINYCIKINLLQKQKNYLFCKQLDQRLKYVFDKRKNTLKGLRHINYSLRVKNSVNSSKTNVTGKKNTGSKVKERKVKKNMVCGSSSTWTKLSEKFIKATSIKRKNPPSPKQWGKKLKTFCQREDIKKARIKKVLLWYCSQFDKNSNPYHRKYLPKYIPQANSMSGFCQKFYEIEQAMLRITEDGSDPNSKQKIKKTKKGVKISYEED